MPRKKPTGRPPVKSIISKQSTEMILDRMGRKDLPAPMSVMLDTMDKFYAEALVFEEKSKSGSTAKVRQEAKQEMRTALARASNVAEKIAPYMHPRLSSTVLTGDKGKDPIQLDVKSLSKLSSAELAVLEGLLSKVKGDAS